MYIVDGYNRGKHVHKFITGCKLSQISIFKARIFPIMILTTILKTTCICIYAPGCPRTSVTPVPLKTKISIGCKQPGASSQRSCQGVTRLTKLILAFLKRRSDVCPTSSLIYAILVIYDIVSSLKYQVVLAGLIIVVSIRVSLTIYPV